uniref:Uncharacterized protein n=1 Tax=Trypanosoma congolense (strain IL3000) TaxID=1068625 RepID=G0V012_TRYCI|nr:hypothetical protein, unlikely [Trypanosoma congolense IL3000]
MHELHYLLDCPHTHTSQKTGGRYKPCPALISIGESLGRHSLSWGSCFTGSPPHHHHHPRQPLIPLKSTHKISWCPDQEATNTSSHRKTRKGRGSFVPATKGKLTQTR